MVTGACVYRDCAFMNNLRLYCGCVWTEVGPASMIVGNLVAGKRIAQASGRDMAQLEDNDQVHIRLMGFSINQESMCFSHHMF